MKNYTLNRRALRDLRILAQVEPRPEVAARAIHRARLAVRGAFDEQPASVRQPRPWLGLVAARRAAIAVVAIVVVAVAVEWVIRSSSPGYLAFAQVQQQVERTKSVQYVQTRKDRIKDDLVEPQETRKVMILGTHQVREEVTMTTTGDPLPEGEDWARILRPYVMIHNYKTGKSIVLYPDQRVFSIVISVLAIDSTSGKVVESKVEPVPKADFYKRFHDIPTEQARSLPDQTIDGKVASVFQIIEESDGPPGIATWTRTYFVDPDKKLPVRIETSLRSSNPDQADTDFVQRDFVFDAPLDEALFSTEPPAGYTDAAKASE